MRHHCEVGLTIHSLYPRDVTDHAQFSFIHLIFEEDRELVMSMWNTLSQGSAVTFEMRWKTQDQVNDTGKWNLTSCVPIFDDSKALVSIAGNCIDIDAQKKSQEATHARLEALEQARMSELKFSRFAQLSPTAIYIFIPETGKYNPLAHRASHSSRAGAHHEDRNAIRQRSILRADRAHQRSTRQGRMVRSHL